MREELSGVSLKKRAEVKWRVRSEMRVLKMREIRMGALSEERTGSYLGQLSINE